MRRNVTLKVATERLVEYRDQWPQGKLFSASWLADIIWPDTDWNSPQGAGGAASAVLKKAGAKWTTRPNGDKGWNLDSIKS
jgi:hypothetical protein